MYNTKEKTTIMEKELAETLKDLLKTHIVGIVEKSEENEFKFMLPGGKTFFVLVKER